MNNNKMPTSPGFLSDLSVRPLQLASVPSLLPIGLWIGQGQQALEVVVTTAAGCPADGVLHTAWEARRARRATPVLLVAIYGDHAALCGATGEKPPVHADLNRGQAERLCREALQQPDRHAALRFLAQVLFSTHY